MAAINNQVNQQNHRVYPKYYQLVKYLFLFTTLIGIAWIGYLIYEATQVDYYVKLSPNFHKSKLYASFISLIVTDSLITLIAIISVMKENVWLFFPVILYRTALAMYYFIQWLLTGSSYGPLFFIWHAFYWMVTGEMSERLWKITD